MSITIEPVRNSLPDLATVKAQLAPEATDEEVAYFLAVAARLDLHPLAGHICLIPRTVNRVKRHSPQVTVDGRRWIAERTGRLTAIDGPEWRGPRDAQGNRPDWLEVWDEDGTPYVARCFVWKQGLFKPANGTAKWDEFVQTYRRDGQTHLVETWERMPSHMLGKVAESMALRRAFPEVQHAIARADAVWTTGDDHDDLVAEAEAGEVSGRAAPTDPGLGAGAQEQPRPEETGGGPAPAVGPATTAGRPPSTVTASWARAVQRSADDQGIEADRMAESIRLVTRGRTAELSEVRQGPEADAVREVLFRGGDA